MQGRLKLVYTLCKHHLGMPLILPVMVPYSPEWWKNPVNACRRANFQTPLWPKTVVSDASLLEWGTDKGKLMIQAHVPRGEENANESFRTQLYRMPASPFSTE